MCSVPRCLVVVAIAIVLPGMLTSCSGGKSTDEPAKESAESPATETAVPENPETKRLDKLITYYTELIRDNPKELNDRGWFAYHDRGEVYAKKGEHDKAIADFTEAIRHYPKENASYFHSRLMGVLNARGNSYQSQRKNDKAIADYTEVIRLSTVPLKETTDALTITQFAAKAYYKRGICYEDQGRHAKAMADYEEASRLAPELLKQGDLKERMSR